MSDPATTSVWRRTAVVCACAAGVFAVAPLVALAPFNIPVSDDYCFASQVRQIGFWKAQWLQYTTNYGRYTALALIGLSPISRSSRHLWFAAVSPIVLVSALGAAFFYLARSVDGDRPWRETLALAALAVTTYVSKMPSVFQGFYWWSSACCFDVGNILSAFAAGGLIRTLDEGARAGSSRNVAMATVCGALAMGANEVTTINLSLVLACFVLPRWIRGRVPRRVWAVAVAWAIAAALALFAPGNLKKFGYSGGISIGEAARRAWPDSWMFARQWIASGPLVPLSLAAGCILVWGAAQRNRRGDGRLVPVWLAGAWLIVFIDEAFMNKVVGPGPHPLRAMNTVYFAFLVSWAGVLWSAAAAVARRWPARAEAVAARTPIAAGAVAIGVLLATLPRQGNLAVAYQDLASGRARTYARDMHARQRRMVEGQILQARALTAMPVTIMSPYLEISEDLLNPVNACVAAYFGLSGVVVTNDDRLMRLQDLTAEHLPPDGPVFIYDSRPDVAIVFAPLARNRREYVIADAFTIQERARNRPAVFIFWDAPDSDRAEIQLWRRLGTTVALDDRVGLLRIDYPKYVESMAAVQQIVADAIERQLAGRTADPFAGSLVTKYAWLRDRAPQTYERIRAAYAAGLALVADAGFAIGPNLALHAYRWTPNDHGSGDLHLLFRASAALGRGQLLVHAVAIPEEKALLPPERAIFGFDDWSFVPSPRMPTWKPGEFIAVHRTVPTRLQRPNILVGLLSAEHRVLGTVQLADVARSMAAHERAAARPAAVPK